VKEPILPSSLATGASSLLGMEQNSEQAVLWIRIGFSADPGSSFVSGSSFGSDSRVLMTKNCEILQLKLGLHKGRPSYMRSIQPSKENIQYL
jgi:hypothetical protein